MSTNEAPEEVVSEDMNAEESEEEVSEDSNGDDSEQTGSEDSEIEWGPLAGDPVEYCKMRCNCPRSYATHRISRTDRNPERIFFSCPKKTFYKQCGYFKWGDHINTISIREMCSECRHLRKCIADGHFYKMERDCFKDDKAKLEAQISELEFELDHIKKRVKLSNETDIKIRVKEETDMKIRVKEETDFKIKEESGFVPPVIKLSHSDIKIKSEPINDIAVEESSNSDEHIEAR